MPMTAQAILNIVATLVPIANALIEKLLLIKNQTEADHPQVWEKVRNDWKDAAANWAKLTAPPAP